MSEYWVSQAKHYCKMCNCWIPDTKTSRQSHESSVRHKSNTERLLKQKRKEALQGSRNEQELQQQLAAIERAALQSVQSDKLQTPSLKNLHTKPSAQRNWNSSSSSSGVSRNESAPPVIKKEENSGIYSIRGKVFLDGRIFEDKLQTGVTCEIFVEEIDEWMPATIVGRQETHIPNTSVSIKKFDVEYSVTNPDGGGEFKELESNVKSDRLRIATHSEKGENYQVLDSYVPPPLPLAPAPPVIQETTGMGKWQTVSVKTVDEEKEWKEHEEAVAEMRKEQDLEIEEKKKAALEEEPIIKGKLYKGFVLEDTAVVSTSKAFSEGSENVTFKKRKLNDFAENKDEGSVTNEGSQMIKPKIRNIRKRDS